MGDIHGPPPMHPSQIEAQNALALAIVPAGKEAAGPQRSLKCWRCLLRVDEGKEDEQLCVVWSGAVWWLEAWPCLDCAVSERGCMCMDPVLVLCRRLGAPPHIPSQLV